MEEKIQAPSRFSLKEKENILKIVSEPSEYQKKNLWILKFKERLHWCRLHQPGAAVQTLWLSAGSGASRTKYLEYKV